MAFGAYPFQVIIFSVSFDIAAVEKESITVLTISVFRNMVFYSFFYVFYSGVKNINSAVIFP